MMEQIRAVARNTFTESIRQPIFLVLLLLGIGLLAINPALSAYTLGDDNKLLLDLGLSTLLLAGMFLAAFTSTGVLSDEIERRTVLTVISKPVARPILILGKYIGVLLAVALAHWIWSLVFLLSVRHRVMERATDVFDQPVLIFGSGALFLSLGAALARNYFARKVFASSLAAWLTPLLTIGALLAFLFDKSWRLQSPLEDLDPQHLIAALLVLEATALICAVAIAASTRLGQMMTLAICSLVFLLGLASESLVGRLSETSAVAKVLALALPNLHLLWLADALTREHAVTLHYVALASSYAILYISGTLAVAVALFENREVG